MQPTDYPRRILVCVSGLSPQVVTETVHALVNQPVPWAPTEVHVLTTTTGRKKAVDMLLAPGADQFGKLVRDAGVPDIAFGPDHIHVPIGVSGTPLDDIRSHGDNMAMADAILHRMAALAADEDCAIHVSLAGGRKSMGFFVGYALSLCGRPQDRLSHVLVSPDFESHPEFFFPPREPRVLNNRANKPVSTADAVVELAEIPFVRLRNHAPKALIKDGHFEDVVRAAQRMAGEPSLVVNMGEHSVTCAGEVVQLPPLGFAIYAWFADRLKRTGESEVVLNEFDAIDSPLCEDLHQFGLGLFANDVSSNHEKWERGPWADPQGNHKDWLTVNCSRIGKKLTDQLGEEGRRVYGIQSRALRGRASARVLDLPATCVEII